MVKVKICGITRLEDALIAVESGADALGFVFSPKSPRHIFPEQAADIIRRLPPFVQTVGLFVNENLTVVNTIADQCGLDIIQLHGEESPEYCDVVCRRIIKAFRIKNIDSLELLGKYQVSGYLLDTWSQEAHGGTGKTFQWEIAAEASKNNSNIILAGGLNPENVSIGVQQVCPYGVDVSSGVESEPGRKDALKIRLFIERAKKIS